MAAGRTWPVVVGTTIIALVCPPTPHTFGHRIGRIITWTTTVILVVLPPRGGRFWISSPSSSTRRFFPFSTTPTYESLVRLRSSLSRIWVRSRRSWSPRIISPSWRLPTVVTTPTRRFPLRILFETILCFDILTIMGTSRRFTVSSGAVIVTRIVTTVSIQFGTIDE